ncbi:MAG TPA: hypothetical protein VH420_08710 [Gaiellaceae bacterium]|jgi:hypothetical protein
MEANLHIPHAMRAHLTARAATHPESWTIQARWLAAAAIVGFTVPFVGSSLLGLQHDLYLGVYFVAVLALVWAYAVMTRLDLRATLARNWKLGVALAIVVGVLLVRNVFSDAATPHPNGAYYWFELVWRGGIYGAVDALLLTVLPCLIVYRSLGGELRSWARRLAYLGASLALVVVMTAIYHVGYSQYRQDGVRAPETGNMIISVPMLLSANPIGSIADHAAMHIAAVRHTYETDVRLPPPASAR